MHPIKLYAPDKINFVNFDVVYNQVTVASYVLSSYVCNSYVRTYVCKLPIHFISRFFQPYVYKVLHMYSTGFSPN